MDKPVELERVELPSEIGWRIYTLEKYRTKNGWWYTTTATIEGIHSSHKNWRSYQQAKEKYDKDVALARWRIT